MTKSLSPDTRPATAAQAFKPPKFNLAILNQKVDNEAGKKKGGKIKLKMKKKDVSKSPEELEYT